MVQRETHMEECTTVQCTYTVYMPNVKNESLFFFADEPGDFQNPPACKNLKVGGKPKSGNATILDVPLIALFLSTNLLIRLNKGGQLDLVGHLCLI